MTARCRRSVLLGALLLGLAPTPGAAAPTTRRPGPVKLPPLLTSGIDRVERALLPRLAGSVTLRVHAIGALIVLDAPQSTPALVRALRLAPLALCPDLDETPSGVVLHCRSRRLVARLSQTENAATLDVAETRGLPWDGEDGAPIVAFEPVQAGLGGRCPGTTLAGRVECLLGRGERDLAVATLGAAADGTSSDELVSLRRGDLAFTKGEVFEATSWWGRTRGHPWERLASARLCELSWACLSGARLEEVYRTAGLPPWAAADLDLRRARAMAFLGRNAAAAALVTGSPEAMKSCALYPVLCRDIAGAALLDPGPGALDALALWVSLPERERSPAAYEATSAAAGVAERESAPLFAANLLAAAAGQVPVKQLREHLLRTAELFVAGGDLVRAGVIVEFAKTRGGDRALAGPRWAAVTRAVQFRSAPRTVGGQP